MQASLLLGLLAAGVTQAIYPPRGPTAPKTNGTKLLTFNETVPASLSPSSVTLAWVASDVDGQYIYSGDDGALILANAVTGENETFVAADQVPSDTHDYWISSDLGRVLFATNYTKQYRYSYFADYQILDLASGSLDPLVSDQVGDIQYAEWDPNGEAIAFVRANDLYIWRDGEVTRITSDGDPDTFNAVPDWVMEEEILGDRYALWWSADGEKIAYLSFNETGVPTFRVPYYMDNTKYGTSYPRELELRYPKVDATNPTVAFNLLDVASSEITPIPIDAFAADDLIIGEVAWVTDGHSNVLFRAYNRVQDSEKVINVDVASASTAVVRERQEDEGWLDNNLAITYVGAAASNGTNGTYYLDLSDVSGWTHIYLYPVNGGAAVPLTSGEWEVRSILKVDTERSLVYYTSTEHHSTESHLYSVSYKTFRKTPLVDDTVPAYWSASFSAGGSYYALSYQGPDVPYQELYSINSTTTPLRTLVDNAAFHARIHEYALPEITWLELSHPSGAKLNVMQRLPAHFDPAKKYPILFNPYGGPGAQQVPKSWKSLNWNAYISSDPELEYVQWVVDGRGTGYKGRAFRALVARQLGTLEAQDQVWAAEQILQNEWADAEHVAIWGWSFGGYLSAKVVELDAGVFTLGLITAPVTDWRFYDSMYTERYMKTYAANAAGYNETAVRKAEGFKNIEGGFLVTHGLGDDNVHFQHTAVLADVLMGEGVSPDKFDSQFFTDSDHGISYNGDSAFLYKLLTKRIYEEKQRVPGEEEYGGHQWSKRQILV